MSAAAAKKTSKSGYLWLDLNDNKVHKRFCQLDRCFIFFVRKRKHSLEHPVGVIDLQGATVSTMRHTDDKPDAWGFTITDARKHSWKWAAKTEKDRREWLDAVRGVLDTPNKKKTIVVEYKGLQVLDDEDAAAIAKANEQVRQFVAEQYEQSRQEIEQIGVETTQAMEEVKLLKEEKKMLAAQVQEAIAFRNQQQEAYKAAERSVVIYGEELKKAHLEREDLLRCAHIFLSQLENTTPENLAQKGVPVMVTRRQEDTYEDPETGELIVRVVPLKGAKTAGKGAKGKHTKAAGKKGDVGLGAGAGRERKQRRDSRDGDGPQPASSPRNRDKDRDRGRDRGDSSAESALELLIEKYLKSEPSQQREDVKLYLGTITLQPVPTFGRSGKDSNVIMTSLSASHMSQEELIDLSQELLDLLANDVEHLLHGEESEFRRLIVDMLLTNLELRRKFNSYSERIMALTREKLERFERSGASATMGGLPLMGGGSRRDLMPTSPRSDSGPDSGKDFDKGHRRTESTGKDRDKGSDRDRERDRDRTASGSKESRDIKDKERDRDKERTVSGSSNGSASRDGFRDGRAAMTTDSPRHGAAPDRADSPAAAKQPARKPAKVIRVRDFV